MPRYESGVSGNPDGRPPGAKSRRTLLIDALKSYGQANDIEDPAAEIVCKLIEKSIGGDHDSTKLILERLLPPPPRETYIELKEVPESEIEKATRFIEAACNGEISIEAARQLMGSLASTVAIYETLELKKELAKLNERLDKMDEQKRVDETPT